MKSYGICLSLCGSLSYILTFLGFHFLNHLYYMYNLHTIKCTHFKYTVNLSYDKYTQQVISNTVKSTSITSLIEFQSLNSFHCVSIPFTVDPTSSPHPSNQASAFSPSRLVLPIRECNTGFVSGFFHNVCEIYSRYCVYLLSFLLLRRISLTGYFTVFGYYAKYA